VFSVVFPQALVNREVTRLRRELRYAFAKLQQGSIDLTSCLVQGETVLNEAFKRVKSGVQQHFNRYNLPYTPETNLNLWQVFTSASTAWQRICKDHGKSKQDGTLLLAVRPENSDGNDNGVGKRWDIINTATLAGFLGFWLTRRGLLMRVDMLASDLHYGTVNTSMLDAAVTLDASWIYWETENDDRVCDICEGYAAGGDNGYYRVGDTNTPIPPPVHPNCRCNYTVIFN